MSLSTVGLGTAVALVALSWAALELTQSPLGVAATLAARQAPSLLLGIPLGSLADRVDRQRLVMWASVLGGATSAAVAVLAVVGALDMPAVLLLSFAFGSIDTVRTTGTQAAVYDIVGSRLATSGIALSNLGKHMSSSVGAMIGGLVVATWGNAWAFALSAMTWVLGAALLVGTRSARSSAAILPKVSLRRTLALLLRNRTVAAIALLVILAEVFGFSGAALVPTFARDVLGVDATGLGILVAARSLGGMAGLGWLATTGSRRRAGPLMLISTGLFGISLVAFAFSQSMTWSTAVMFVAGAAGATIDTLGQTLLQRNSPDQERGAAMGVWVFSIGFGPIGLLAISAAAVAVGVPAAQALSGLVLVGIAVTMARATAIAKLP